MNLKTIFAVMITAALGLVHGLALDRLGPSRSGCGHTATARQQEIERTPQGRIKRSRAECARFKRLTGYPHGRPGYQIDHVVPLKRGGIDCACNMQWLRVDVKRIKDRVE